MDNGKNRQNPDWAPEEVERLLLFVTDYNKNVGNPAINLENLKSKLEKFSTIILKRGPNAAWTKLYKAGCRYEGYQHHGMGSTRPQRTGPFTVGEQCLMRAIQNQVGQGNGIAPDIEYTMILTRRDKIDARLLIHAHYVSDCVKDGLLQNVTLEDIK